MLQNTYSDYLHYCLLLRFIKQASVISVHACKVLLFSHVKQNLSCSHAQRQLAINFGIQTWELLNKNLIFIKLVFVGIKFILNYYKAIDRFLWLTIRNSGKRNRNEYIV